METCSKTYMSWKGQGTIFSLHEKAATFFDILKGLFVRHLSEHTASDSDRKFNRNIYPDAATRDRMRLIDPKSGQLGPVHHYC